MSSGESIDVRLPANLCNDALQHFGSRFANIGELITFVLRECVQSTAVEMDQNEQRILETRLKDLGYV